MNRTNLLAARVTDEELEAVRAEIRRRPDLFDNGHGGKSDFVRHAIKDFLARSRREREARRCK